MHGTRITDPTKLAAIQKAYDERSGNGKGDKAPKGKVKKGDKGDKGGKKGKAERAQSAGAHKKRNATPIRSKDQEEDKVDA